jgi:hypothetical protein
MVPVFSVPVLRLRAGKAQEQDMLSVSGGQMTYTPESASDGNIPMTFACSDIREIAEKPQPSDRGDFAVRTALGDIDFRPTHPPFDASTLRSACSK